MHLRFNYRFKSRESGVISLEVGLYLLTSRNQVDDKPRYNDMPITPNLLKDSKHFKGICKEMRNTWMEWNEAFGGDWQAYIHRKDNPANTAGVDVEARPRFMLFCFQLYYTTLYYMILSMFFETFRTC